MLKRYSQQLVVVRFLGDAACAVAAWGLAYVTYFHTSWFGPTSTAFSFTSCLAPIVFTLLLIWPVYDWFHLHSPRRTRGQMDEALDCIKAVILIWLMTYAMLSFLDWLNVSRLMYVLVLAFWLPLAVSTRLAGRFGLQWLRRHGWNLRHASIVGTGRAAQKLFHTLRRATWMGIDVRFFVDDNPGRELLGRPVHGPIGSLPEILRLSPVDIVFVALPGGEYDKQENALNALAMTEADVEVIPDLLAFHFLSSEPSQLGDLPLISMTHNPQYGFRAFIKRLIDVIGASMLLLILGIPMAIIALAIKLTSRGPVFYLQTRASLGGKHFQMIKFRTMATDAESATGAVWTQRDDPRITSVGRFLRKSSLDELPQLFNVLLGQMSLVGPRPERPELITRFRSQVPRYMLRHHVKAGLTGWAQVHGLRGQTSLRKRVQYDLYYIVHWSISLDLIILLMTPFRSMFHPNAY